MGDNLLVHCSAEASRSPAVAAMALVLYEEVDLETAFELVVNNRNAVDLQEAIARQTVRVYIQQRGWAPTKVSVLLLE